MSKKIEKLIKKARKRTGKEIGKKYPPFYNESIIETMASNFVLHGKENNYKKVLAYPGAWTDISVPPFRDGENKTFIVKEVALQVLITILREVVLHES